MAPARGPTALAGAGIVRRTALPFHGRRRQRRPSHRRNLRQIRNLKSRRRWGLLAISIASQRRHKRIRTGNRRRVWEIDGGRRIFTIDHTIPRENHGRIVVGLVLILDRNRRDLLDRNRTINPRPTALWFLALVGRRGQRSPPEPSVTGSGPTQKRNHLLELGNGDIRHGPAIHLHFPRRSTQLLLRLLLRLLLLTMRQQPYQLLDAFQPSSGFLHSVLLHFVGKTIVSVTHHQLHSHVLATIKQGGEKKKSVKEDEKSNVDKGVSGQSDAIGEALPLVHPVTDPSL